MYIPKKFDIIKHKRFSDIALAVEKVYDFDHKWKVKGDWINQGFVDTYPLGIKAKIVIPAEKLSEWLICKNPNAQCIRYEEWKPLT